MVSEARARELAAYLDREIEPCSLRELIATLALLGYPERGREAASLAKAVRREFVRLDRERLADGCEPGMWLERYPQLAD